MINGSSEDIRFGVQEKGENKWYRVIDTSAAGPDDFREEMQRQPLTEYAYTVAKHSVVVLARE